MLLEVSNSIKSISAVLSRETLHVLAENSARSGGNTLFEIWVDSYMVLVMIKKFASPLDKK